MRLIVVSILFGCLFGLIVGCGGGGGGDQVEIPKNPAPLPKNPKLGTVSAGPAGEGAGGGQVPPLSPAGAPRGKK